MIPRFFVMYHFHNITIQNSKYEDSDSDSDSDVSHVWPEASSMSSYQLRKKDKGTKNVVERKDVFDIQQLEESFNMSKNYKKYGTQQKSKMKSYSNKQLRRNNIIWQEVKMMKHSFPCNNSHQIPRNPTEM